MRKCEVIGPRKLLETEADAVYDTASSDAKSIKRDIFRSCRGHREWLARNGIVACCVP